jgi:hypothetical protein
MSAAEGLFVQYSVVAVFGSVLGCVMLPLITQSYESLIFSMVLIGLTAPRFYRKAKSNDQHGHVKDVERGSKKNPETSHGTKKKKKVNLVSQQVCVTIMHTRSSGRPRGRRKGVYAYW